MNELEIINRLFDHCSQLPMMVNSCESMALRAIWVGLDDYVHVVFGVLSGSSSSSSYFLGPSSALGFAIPTNLKLDKQPDKSWAVLFAKDGAVFKRWQYCEEAPIEVTSIEKLALL